MRAFEIAYGVFVTLYMLTWVVRFLARRTNFFISVLCLLSMSAGLVSHRDGSTALFWAGFLLATFWTNGGGDWTRRGAASLSAALTEVARASFRRDVSTSS